MRIAHHLLGATWALVWLYIFWRAPWLPFVLAIPFYLFVKWWLGTLN